jgi:LemA protein
MVKWIVLGLLGVMLLVGGMLVLGGIGSYNSLVALNEQVEAQWGQVQNVYQRRLDLVPNLVNTVKGAAAFERETLQSVTEARARAGQVTIQAGPEILEDPQAFERFAQAQQQLGSALSRLLVTVERYPELRATENFRDLQAQLEGTENRISVERMRFNEAARAFNSRRNSFPTVVFAGLFGDRFRAKQYFRAQEGAEQAPTVTF